MRYMLLIYVNEAAMAAAPTEKTYEISAAYGAYTEALKKAGAWLARRPAEADPDRHDGAVRQRQDQRARRSLCRHQGAARRLLHDRVPDIDAGDRLGGALPRRQRRHGRGAADLGTDHVMATMALADRAGGGGSGRPAELRQAGRLARRPHARCRRRRGRAGRCLRGGAGALAGERRAGQAGSLAACGGAAARGSTRSGAG